MTEVPMYINELMGVRYWLYDDIEPLQGKTRLLRNLGCSRTSNKRGWWHHGKNISTCHHKYNNLNIHPGPIDIPHWKCSCGLHAYGNFNKEIKQYANANGLIKIPGIVKMWGRILTYKTLIRAQYAEIIGLFDSPFYTDEVRSYIMELCTEYGYDFLDYFEFQKDDVLREYAESYDLMMLEDISYG